MSKNTKSIVETQNAAPKFKNKYRIASTRLRNWDYAADGYYFVTICTKDKKCYFGNVLDSAMKLSKIGKIANVYWQEIPKHFPFVELDEFIVMPNHIHGIIIINNIVETQNVASLQLQRGAKNKFGPQSKNLASIIRGFKIGVKKWATINNIPFQWQSRFYDNIVRNGKSLSKIRQYIANNPSNWERDKNNAGNLYI